MAHESRGLGRGLEALLTAKPRATAAASDSFSQPHALPVTVIQAGGAQPRRSISRESLEGLAASIKAKGVIEPIVVRPLPTGAVGAPTHEIVAGERRWQAAKLAGLTEIPVVIRDVSDQDAVAIALIENIQREELTPAEEARALQRLIGEFALTHLQVADVIGRSRAAVSNLLRLLDLPAAVVAMIDAKSLSMGHARALLGLEDDADRERLAKRIAQRGLSVRETEELVRKFPREEGRATASKRPEWSVVSELLRTKGVHVHLHQKTSGSGKLIVEFADSQSRDVVVSALKSALQD
jgi:ParB family chromosome partitioning protein